MTVCICICIQMWNCVSKPLLMCDRLSQRTQLFVVSRLFTHTVQTDRNMMLIFFNSKCNVIINTETVTEKNTITKKCSYKLPLKRKKKKKKK